MCCIFTCCGWMIDLVQRAWVFAMSCCISSAVCCFMVTASMSGVALGYNYSLAEYIELKETNVSVFLKRGVFDDEVVDEMDWRRGGGGPPAAERSGAESSEAPSSVPDFPFGYRRANDEGMFATTQINPPNDLYGHDPDHNRFEGSLLKLTSKPKNVAGDMMVTQDSHMAKVMTGYPQDSIDQLKAVQGLMNRRKMEDNPLALGEYKGFMMPNLIMSTTDYTGSVPQESAGTSAAWGVSEELKLIQKLLNERKEAAMKFDNMKRTTKIKHPQRPSMPGELSEVFPNFLAGPTQARRMGNAGVRAPVDPAQVLQDRMQSVIKEAPKWYYPKHPDLSMTIWTSPKGPVTIHNFITRTKLKPDNITPLSQENFRRAMQDASINKNEKINVVQTMPANEPPTEPQKDYDEEEVKGIPVRRKRKKRNRRSILDPQSATTKQSMKTDPTNEIVSFGNRNSLFNKLMAVLINFKLMFATETAAAKVLLERSSETLPTASSVISNSNIVASSYINVGASSTEALRAMKIIKSTVAAF